MKQLLPGDVLVNERNLISYELREKFIENKYFRCKERKILGAGLRGKNIFDEAS